MKCGLWILLAIGTSSRAAILRGTTSTEGENLADPSDLTCAMQSIQGDEDSCKATVDQDGKPCEWCVLNSAFGFCVNEDQAEAMKKTVPNLDCTSGAPSGDDDTPATDDNTPSEDDDSAPDEYWKCLKTTGGEQACDDAGCVYCMTSAGYGICLDEEAADQADKSDWFDCKNHTAHLQESGPFGVSCLTHTVKEDPDGCKATVDGDGKNCEWCTLLGHDFCASADQAAKFEQVGAECDTTVSSIGAAGGGAVDVNDPYDTTCLMATLSGDKSVCEQTVDADGNPCHWCDVNGYEVCLDDDQAEIVDQAGGSCDSKVKTSVTLF